MNTNKM